MRHVALGSAYRAVRLELRLRQGDVASRAGVSQQTVSRIERGDLGPMSVDALEAIAAALEADLRLSLGWRGSGLARLMDRRHARLQDLVAARLVEAGWEVVVEDTFNHFGERGSVDILAWRADVRALLVIEIKSELVDLQDTVATLDRKIRVVPQVVSGSRGWRAESVGGVLVLPDSKTHRVAVASHGALMRAAFPARTLEVRRWLAQPSGALRGIWFLSITHQASGIQRFSATRRVYRPRKAASRPKAGT